MIPRGGKDTVRPESTVPVELLNSPEDCVVASPQIKYERVRDNIGLRLVERYIEGEVYILVVFTVCGESRKLAALLKRSGDQLDSLGEVAERSCRLCAKPQGNEAPMLVDVIKLVQPPEAILLSSVWVKPFDDLLHFIPHAVHCPSYRATSSLVDGTFLVIGNAVLLPGTPPPAMTSSHAK
jgi:hypothetical protein